MTSDVFQDAVAIDTNVFVQQGTTFERDGHISALLTYLRDRGVELIVDERGVIFNEYLDHVEPIVRANSDVADERYILSYWFRDPPKKTVRVSNRDRLMIEIERIIPGDEQRVDRVFVFVAFNLGRILISNDENHIVLGPNHERNNPRRDRLLRATRRIRPDGADILTSSEACAEIPD